MRWKLSGHTSRHFCILLYKLLKRPNLCQESLAGFNVWCAITIVDFLLCLNNLISGSVPRGDFFFFNFMAFTYNWKISMSSTKQVNINQSQKDQNVELKSSTLHRFKQTISISRCWSSWCVQQSALCVHTNSYTLKCDKLRLNKKIIVRKPKGDKKSHK